MNKNPSAAIQPEDRSISQCSEEVCEQSAPGSSRGDRHYQSKVTGHWFVCETQKVIELIEDTSSTLDIQEPGPNTTPDSLEEIEIEWSFFSKSSEEDNHCSGHSKRITYTQSGLQSWNVSRRSIRTRPCRRPSIEIDLRDLNSITPLDELPTPEFGKKSNHCANQSGFHYQESMNQSYERDLQGQSTVAPENRSQGARSLSIKNPRDKLLRVYNKQARTPQSTSKTPSTCRPFSSDHRIQAQLYLALFSALMMAIGLTMC